jgi:hypothetical protein
LLIVIFFFAVAVFFFIFFYLKNPLLCLVSHFGTPANFSLVRTDRTGDTSAISAGSAVPDDDDFARAAFRHHAATVRRGRRNVVMLGASSDHSAVSRLVALVEQPSPPAPLDAIDAAEEICAAIEEARVLNGPGSPR